MFERFSEQARQVVELAREEARLLRSSQVGSEHLLVAVARLDDDVAADVLHAHGLTGEQARGAVAKLVGVGESDVGGELPFTDAVRHALDAALRESLQLGQAQIEPAHLLLAVMRQTDAVARRVLATVGAHPPQVRAEVIERLGGDPAGPAGDDGELLLEILERGGPVSAWLRAHGVDEPGVRRMLGS